MKEIDLRVNVPSWTLVVAISKNGVIGKDGQLPWHLPADLKHFKATTLGKTILMGRLTWESIGRPLPRRRNMVLSSRDLELPNEVGLVSTLGQAVKATEGEEVMLIGGAQVYRSVLERGWVQRIILTRVLAEVEGDAFLELPLGDFTCVEVDEHRADDKHPFGMRFETYNKKE
jgi:dihydrofolate reductase